MSDQTEHRITDSPGRGVGPQAPPNAWDPVGDLLRSVGPPSRLAAWVVGLAGLLAAFSEWGSAKPDRVAAALCLIASSISFGLLSAGARRK